MYETFIPFRFYVEIIFISRDFACGFVSLFFFLRESTLHERRQWWIMNVANWFTAPRYCFPGENLAGNSGPSSLRHYIPNQVSQFKIQIFNPSFANYTVETQKQSELSGITGVASDVAATVLSSASMHYVYRARCNGSWNGTPPGMRDGDGAGYVVLGRGEADHLIRLSFFLRCHTQHVFTPGNGSDKRVSSVDTGNESAALF